MSLSSLCFRVASAEEIKGNAVLEVTKSKLDANDYTNTVYDVRMGPMNYNQEGNCITCELSNKECPGHIGYIALTVPIINPLYEKEIMRLARVYCFKCSSLVRKENFDINPTTKVRICLVCGVRQPEWAYNDHMELVATFTKQDNVIVHNANDIYAWFCNFSNESLRSIGLFQNGGRPENLIIKLFPIMPPCVRPIVYIDDKMLDDDLTTQYIEIIKHNDTLKTLKDIPKTPKDKDTEIYYKNLHSLYFKISTLMNNSAGKGKHNTNNKATKGIKEIITAKKGIVRNNAAAKRVEQSGRTVIGPDSTLRVDEVGIPRKMAEILSKKMDVNERSYDYIQELFTKKKINCVIRNGQVIEADKVDSIIIGDKVERQLQDGDVILTNRQPTLHKGGMMSLKVKVRETKTITLNLCLTKSFNADFDGDEGNIHVPQSFISEQEFNELSSPQQIILSPQNGQANITLVQDNILACYLMTSEDFDLEKGEFMDICMWLTEEVDVAKKMAHVRRYIPNYCGRSLLSMCFPDTFSYGKDDVSFEMGCIHAGTLNKKIMNEIIKILYHVYDPDTVLNTLSNIQFITNKWLAIRGFSVGLEDCMINCSREEINRVVQKYETEADICCESITHTNIKELKIGEKLNNARDASMKLAKDSFKKDNNFLRTVQSGSKGDFFNIAQISGLLGQQYFNGARIANVLNNGTRSLYHYPLGQKPTYESQGFIKNCFLVGLTLRETYHHAVAGRSGIVDTAMSTGDTGYMQRKLIKCTEDFNVKYDQTVRDENENLCQYLYGSGLQIINPSGYLKHIVNKINNERLLKTDERGRGL